MSRLAFPPKGEETDETEEEKQQTFPFAGITANVSIRSDTTVLVARLFNLEGQNGSLSDSLAASDVVFHIRRR